MGKQITAHICSPSLNEILNVEISLNATVISLKHSIESVHPNHPSTANQRIIFRGKLLQDTDILNDVLKKVEEGIVPTFHLVVKPSLEWIPKQIPTKTISQPITEPQPINVQNTNQNYTISAYPSLLPGGYQIVFINGQYYLAPVLTPSQPFTLPQQQQQEQQQQQQQNPFIQQFILPQQPQQQQQRQPFFGLNGIAGRQVNNAQRATSIWLALKLVIMLFMVCQGASIERIFIFHILAFIFFLYQTGRLRIVFRRIRVEDLNGVPPGQQQNAQQPNDNEITSATQTEPQQQAARPLTRLDVLKRGICTFFASLLPSYGADPQIARAFENNNE